MNNELNGIKLLKKGVRGKDGKYHPCWYCKGERYIRNTEGGIDGAMQNAITIYAREYTHLPAEFHPQNDSDSMTDYFEKDRCVFFEGSKEYDILLAFLDAPAKPKKAKAPKESEPVKIKERHDNNQGSLLYLSCGKAEATVGFYSKSGCVSVLCNNASNRVWGGLGKTFSGVNEAIQSYRSDAMRKMIMTAAGAMHNEQQQAA